MFAYSRGAFLGFSFPPSMTVVVSEVGGETSPEFAAGSRRVQPFTAAEDKSREMLTCWSGGGEGGAADETCGREKRSECIFFNYAEKGQPLR